MADNLFTGLFTPPSTPDPFAALFDHPPMRETCYGYVTDEEFERRKVAARAKVAARRECTLCDRDGYRGTVVCDHVDRSGAGERVRREIRKKRFTVVKDA